MLDEGLLYEIDKTMKFVHKKITEGRMIVDKINSEKRLIINIKDGDYNIEEVNINTDISYTNVLILGEEDTTLEDIKRSIEKEDENLDNGGLLVIKHLIFNEEHMDSVKEEILELLVNKGIEETKVYFVYSKTELANKNLSVVIVGRKKLDLLKDSIEYEEYSSNMVIEKKCGGCGSKKEGCCSKKDGCSSGGCKGKSCCKNKK